MKREWIHAPVANRVDWDEGLMTIRLDADIGPFKAGQFVDLGVKEGEDMTSRSYSISSAPSAPLEFYITLVDDGALTPSLFRAAAGDHVWVRSGGAGMFTLEHVDDAQSLWLVSTGTGLGPYISMLRDGDAFARFSTIVVLHGVRYAGQLGYREELEALATEAPNGCNVVYLPAVTRQPDAKAVLHGRITDLLLSGELEKAAGVPMDAESAQVMLCGNPDMLKQMKEILKERGMTKATRRRPGQFHLEAYW